MYNTYSVPIFCARPAPYQVVFEWYLVKNNPSAEKSASLAAIMNIKLEQLLSFKFSFLLLPFNLMG
jgi:hypothetical protein